MPGKRSLGQIQGRGSSTLHLSIKTQKCQSLITGPCLDAEGARSGTYPLAIRVVKRLELYNIGVSDDAHNLQFTVLNGVRVSDPAVDGERERGDGLGPWPSGVP